MRYELVTISDDHAPPAVHTVKVIRLVCGLNLITACCGHAPPTAQLHGQDSKHMIAERMPDVAQPERPSPDKPADVEPIKPPGTKPAPPPDEEEPEELQPVVPEPQPQPDQPQQ